MSHTNPWSTAFELTPAGTASRKEGDDRIRELKVSVRERLLLGGHYMTLAATDIDKGGRHTVGMGGDGGPHIYKSDGTTRLISFTDTNMALQANMGLTSIDGLNSTVLKVNAATKSNSIASTFIDTSVAFGATGIFNGPTLTLGATSKGTVLVVLSAVLEAIAVNDMVSLNVQFEYLPDSVPGIWTGTPTYMASGLHVPARTGLNKGRVTHSLVCVDPMTTPALGGTVNSRVQVFNNHASADVIVRYLYFTLVELRR